MRYATPLHISLIRPVEQAGWCQPAGRPPRLPRRQARLGFAALAAATGFFAVASGAQAGGVDLPIVTDEGAVSATSAVPETALALSVSTESQPAASDGASLVSAQYQAEIPDINADSSVGGTEGEASAGAAVTVPAAEPASEQPTPATAPAGDDTRQLGRQETAERAPVKAQEQTLVARLASRRHEARQPRLRVKRYRPLHLQYQFRSLPSVRTVNSGPRIAETLVKSKLETRRPDARRSSDIILESRPMRHSSNQQHVAKWIPEQTRVQTSGLISPTDHSVRRHNSKKLEQPTLASARLARSAPQRPVDPRTTVEPPPAGPQQLSDGRRLLQLGLALGLAYVLFLVFWFWRTRDRHRSVGRVLRL